MRTAAELARAVWADELEFEDALQCWLEQTCPDQLDEGLYFTLAITIGYAAMGRWNEEIPISEDEEMTVREVIEKYGLEPFVMA